MKQNIYAAGVFFVLAAAFVFNVPTNSSEWASWVQAIGSVAAILGAVWLARADQRKVEAESLVMAEVTAASVLYPLGALKGCMEACIKAMSNDHPGQNEFTMRKKDIDNLHLPDAEQIAKLVVIGGEVSIELAQVVTTAKMASSLLERCSRTDFTHEQRVSQCKGVARLIQDVPDRVVKVRAKILEFLVKRGHTVVKRDIHPEQTPPPNDT